MKQAIIDLLSSKKFLAALGASVIYIAGRDGFDLDPTVLDRIFAALLVYVGAQGVADVGKSAAIARAASEPGDRRNSELGHAGLTLLVMLAVTMALIGAMVASNGCASARARGGAAARAFLDCEAPNVDQALLEEAKHVATGAVVRWISGDGHVDTAGLRSEAAPLKSDLLRCAMDAAIAAISAPTPKLSGVAQVAGFEVNRSELVASYSSLRLDLGWPAASR